MDTEMQPEMQTMYSNLALLFYILNRRVIEEQQRQLGLAPVTPVHNTVDAAAAKKWFVVQRMAEIAGFFLGRCCGQMRFWRQYQPIHIPVHVPIPVPMPMRSERGMSPYAAKLVTDALLARDEMCPVSLESLGDFEEILVGECGHACGATEETVKLDQCPVCRDATVWCRIKTG